MVEAWNYDANNCNWFDRFLKYGARYLSKTMENHQRMIRFIIPTHQKFIYLGHTFHIAISKIGGALRCQRCSSEFDSACGDKFQNSTRQFMIDCSADRVYDLTPIDLCRKIKYKGGVTISTKKQPNTKSFHSEFYHFLLNSYSERQNDHNP